MPRPMKIQRTVKFRRGICYNRKDSCWALPCQVFRLEAGTIAVLLRQIKTGDQMSERILVLDDEIEIADLVSLYLKMKAIP